MRPQANWDTMVRYYDSAVFLGKSTAVLTVLVLAAGWVAGAEAEQELPPGSTWLRIDGMQQFTVPDEPVDPPVDACEADPEADGCECPAGYEGDVWPDCAIVVPPEGDCTSIIVRTVESDGVGPVDLMDGVQAEENCTVELTVHRPPSYGLVDLDGTMLTYLPQLPVEEQPRDKARYIACYVGTEVCGVSSAWFFDSSEVEPPAPIDPCEEDPTAPGCDDGGGTEPPEPPPEYNYPEVPRTYTPQAYTAPIPEKAEQFLQDYSTDLPVVEQGPDETLQALVDRAQRLHPAGAVALVDRHYQCEKVKYTPSDGTFVIRGVVKPRTFVDTMTGDEYLKDAGPRFYCMGDDPEKIGGTIPMEVVKGEKFWRGNPTAKGSLYFEDIEVAGYQAFATFAITGYVEYRRSYMHSGLLDGMTTGNSGGRKFEEMLDPIYNDPCNLTVSFVQTEVSHWGQGNFKHNAYTHSCFGGTKYAPALTEKVRGYLTDVQGIENPTMLDLYDTGIFPDQGQQINIIASDFHSARWASTFKTIGDSVNVIGSRLAVTAELLGIEDNLPTDYSQALFDAATLATINIWYSELFCYKDDKKGGSMCMGARARKTALRSGGKPFVWEPYHQPYYWACPVNNPDCEEVDWIKFRPLPRILPENPIATDPLFWAYMDGVQPFVWSIEGNMITEVKAEGESRSNSPMSLDGSAWMFDGGRGSNGCRLPMPKNAYEMMRVVWKNNDVSGFDRPMFDIYQVFGHQPRCGYPMPEEYPTAESFKRYGVIEADSLEIAP